EVSKGHPGPIKGFHHAALGSSGYSTSWACALPVNACVIRMALSPSALRVPHVSYASVTGPSCPPRCNGNESKVYELPAGKGSRSSMFGGASCTLPPTVCSVCATLHLL